MLKKVLSYCVICHGSQDSGSQETNQCRVSNMSQPALHPVPCSHRSGRKAFVCTAALTQQQQLTLIQPVSTGLKTLAHPADCPVLAWPGGSCTTPEDHQVDFYAPSMRKESANSYCSALCCFIIHIHRKFLLDLHTNVL